jgi:hypothetical protein
MPMPTPMPQERPRPRRAQRRRLLSVLGALLLLALVAVCGIRVVPFVRARLAWLELPTSNVAPSACAHETAHTSLPALHDSLFAAVSSSVTAGTAGLLQRGVPIIDANDALCIVRTSDGAIVGHYALAYGVAELAQADGVLYALQQDADGSRCTQRVVKSLSVRTHVRCLSVLWAGAGPRRERGPQNGAGRAGPSGANVARWGERRLRSPRRQP